MFEPGAAPLTESSGAVAGPEPQQDVRLQPCAGALRILIADDSAVYRDGLARAMDRSPDFHVVAAVDDGLAVPALVREHQPDVALLDRRLPGVSGSELTQALLPVLRDNGGIAILISAEPPSPASQADGPAPRAIDKALSRREILDAIRELHAGSLNARPAAPGGSRT
jgi:DNA-binding NarL/FixJ family response regulator